MHPSLSNMLLGEHFEELQTFGLAPASFFELDASKRHALAVSISTARSKGHRSAISDACDQVSQKGNYVPVSSLLHSGVTGIPQNVFTRIADENLWSRKQYRQFIKLLMNKSSQSVLRHSGNISTKDLVILNELPEAWQKPKILKLLNNDVQARALMCLGEAIRFVAGDTREKAFIGAINRCLSFCGVEERFWRILYRDQEAPTLPAKLTENFERIYSEKQCKSLAKAGHCFGELSMIEAVFSSESLFYSWSGAKDAVVELVRDTGPFGWYVDQACRPKAKSLTKPQMRSLDNDLKQLEAPVSSFQWSRKVQNAFRALKK